MRLGRLRSSLAGLRGYRRESRAPAFLRLARFFFPVPRRRTRGNRGNQPFGDCGNLVDRAVERDLIGARWPIHAAQLTDELKGGCADLIWGRGRLKVREGLDIPTHARLLDLAYKKSAPLAGPAILPECVLITAYEHALTGKFGQYKAYAAYAQGAPFPAGTVVTAAPLGLLQTIRCPFDRYMVGALWVMGVGFPI